MIVPIATEFQVDTKGQALYEITDKVSDWVSAEAVETGMLTLFLRHTSASLLIQENADPDVQTDLKAYFERMVPFADDPSMQYLRHRSEGPDDMPAHIKAAMLPVSLSIPILAGKMALGTWQGIYVFEHRSAPRTRRVAAMIQGGHP